MPWNTLSFRRRPAILVALIALATPIPTAFPAGAESAAVATGAQTMHATGTFDVKIRPLALDGPASDDRLGRMSIDKQYHGDLEGTGLGQMLTAQTTVETSAVYVAIERVTGVLAGRRGSFVLHHRGLMTKEGRSLEVSIVPDSGTGELAGIAGKLAIEIEGGIHRYALDYTLPGAP